MGTQNHGFFGYKLHPKGEDLQQDLEADALVREATGPDFILISDPVANMNPEEAIRLGRFLEKLD
jgi:L-alanine-DL-glutamate epimerase-like enolase superfamily enzyme